MLRFGIGQLWCHQVLRWETATDLARMMARTTFGCHSLFPFSPEKAGVILFPANLMMACVQIINPCQDSMTPIQNNINHTSIKWYYVIVRDLTTARCSVSFACWWSWAGERWKSSTSPEKSRRPAGHLCHGEREYGPYYLEPTSFASMAWITATFSRGILERHQLNKQCGPVNVGWHAGGWTSDSSCSNREGLSTHASGSGILQASGWPPET